MPTSQTGQRQARPAGTADAQTGDSKSASTTVGSTPRAERKIEVRTVAPPAAGTLTGLGEAFQGPGQSGSAELTIPFTVTPARGLEPQLTLRYDSGGHNGVFGQGADLALSSVTLSNNRQMPTYDGADPYALDGAALVQFPIRRAAQCRWIDVHGDVVPAATPDRLRAHRAMESRQWRRLLLADIVARR